MNVGYFYWTYFLQLTDLLSQLALILHILETRFMKLMELVLVQLGSNKIELEINVELPTFPS